MKENIIQLLNVAGTPTACYQLDSVENLSSLYNGQLFRIGQKGLIDYDGNVDSASDNSEKYRFVVAKNPEEKDMLLKVQPIRCYLRDHEMSSKVIEINPYQSVRWLKNLIEKQRRCSVKLVVNEQQLTEESDSLLKYIHENAIIHVIEMRQTQKKIAVIYSKQPGPQSKVHRIENVLTDNKIQWLAKQISRLTSIPFEFLFLIYGGHVLPKDRHISQYHIQPNGCIYAVDSRKYMKKVSKQQYQSRLEEVRKVKQNNKAVVQKVKQQNERKKKQKPVQKLGKSKGVYQKSGQVIADVDDTDYFKNPQMNIQSQQIKQFDRRGKVLQESCENKGYPIRVDTSQRVHGDPGFGTPPNSPIFLFNRQQSYNSANNELKQGRIITKDTDVYQDKLGFTHEHDKQKIVFKSGKTKIVQVDVAKDQEGNVIKVEHDYVKVKRDPETGHTTKIQTDIIEDSQHGRTIIKRQQVRDKDGNVIKSETDIIKSESNQKSNKKQQRDTITQGDKVTSYNTQVFEDSKGIPVKIQTDMTERKQDESGNTHQYSKDVKQQDGVTTVIERNVIRDKQGNIIQLKTDVIKITEDEQGNIYKHQRNQIDKQNKKVVIERDIVTDRHGEVISKETDMKMVEEDADSNIHKHETDIIEGIDGRTIVIQKNIIQDSEGNVIKSQTDMFELNKGEKRQPQQMQIQHGQPEAITVQNQKQPLINGGTQVTIDELGNTHTREKQLVEKQGKTTFVDRDTVQDPRGKIIRVETDIVQIQGDDQGNMHKHKSEIIQSEGKVVMVETDIVMDPDGVTIRKQKDTIEIDQSEDGSVIKHEKDVIQQDGKTKIIVKDIVEDADGNVIRSETKVTEIEEDQYTVNVHEKQQVVQAVEDDGTLVEGDSSIRKQVEVIQDQDGNTLTRQKQLIEDEEGKTTVVYRNIIQNAQGDILKEQTQMMHVTDESGAPQLHRHAIDYSESNSGVKIQETTSRQNFDGSIIRSQKETIQIQQQQDGTIKRKQMDIVQQNGKKTVHVKNIFQDQTGKLISKTSDIIELQSIESGRPNLAVQRGETGLQRYDVGEVNVQRTYNVDDQGNVHIVETEIKNAEGQQTMVERQFISNDKGELIKTQTGILQIQQGRYGSTRLTATDIVQQGNLVTIIQNDSIQDSEGNQIRTESGTMQIQDIGSGVTRKQKQNIIQEGGIRVKIEKQTFHDEQGNILQEKVRTTELTDQYDQHSGELVSEGYKRKEKQVVEDGEGNTIWREKEVVDKQQGQTTIVETEVIRDEEGKLVKATTDVVQMTEQQDGTVHRHETNIVEKPGKMTIAESKTVENAEGERLQGEVQSIVVSKGENGEIIKKQTGIIMEDLQKTIVERIIVEDAQGNVIKAETKKKRIYTDENGVEQARDVQTYEVSEEQILGQPSTFQKQIIEDAEGNKRTIERQTIQEDGQTKVVQTTTIQNADGSLARLETDVLQIRKSESGTQLVKQTNIIEDENKLTVMQNSSLSNREGEVLISKTQILQLVQGQDGKTKKTVTNVLEQAGRTTITEKKAIQTEDGDIIDQSMNVTKIIQHRDGSVEVIENSQPYQQLEQQGQGQYTEVDSIIRDPVEVELAPVKEKQILEDMEGNVHTLEKQIIINEDGTTVIKSETIQNPSGKVLTINTNIVDMKELEDGKKLRHQTEIVSGQKLVTTQIYTIQNPDGSIHSEKTRKVEIQEDDGLIKTSKIDVVRRDGQTMVTGTQTLEDEDGNIIDQSNNQLNISQSQEAVREQAKRIAKAEIHGEITGIFTEYHEDEDGNRHIVERQTIQQDGKKITVDHSTVKNEDGEVVIVQTNIVTETQRGDGKIERNQTQITEQGGKTRVIQYSEIKESDQALQQLQSSAKSGNLSDLLGFNQEAPQEPGTIKYTTFDIGGSQGDLLLESVKEPLVITSHSKKGQEFNLLDDSLTNSQHKISDLPLESRKQLDFNKKYKEKSEEQKQLPEEYQITIINKQRVQVPMTIRYDEIIDELAEKLGNKIGKSKQSIKFYKDGNELQQYELVSDLDILPGTELYYYVEQQEQQ